MKNSQERDMSVMSEWHSTALIHNLSPASTILNAIRFSLILSITCAKEGHEQDILRVQEKTFSELCKSMRECLDHMTVDQLAAGIMEAEILSSGKGAKVGPWGRELK